MQVDTTRLDIIVASILEETIVNHNYVVATERTTAVTKVEIISVNEIYLLDEVGIRMRRICGAPLSGTNMKLRCRHPAGRKTGHLGFGRCKLHQSRWDNIQGSGQSLEIFKTLQQDSRAITMLELYELHPRLFEGTNISSLDGEIGVLTTILYDAVANNLDRDTIIEIIESLTKTKMARSKIEVDKLLIDIKAIKLFIQQFLDLAKKNMSPEQYSVIVTAFRKDLKFPTNDSMRKLILENNENSTN